MIQKTFHVIVIVCLMLALGCNDDGLTNETDNNDMSEGTISEIKVNCLVDVENVDDGTWAIVTFSNKTNHDVPILKWKLLNDGKMTWAAFDIYRDSEEVSYKGIMIKRGTPAKEDYYILAANQSIVSRIKISNYYDISIPGKYTIAFFSYYHFPNSNVLFEIKSNIAKFWRGPR